MIDFYLIRHGLAERAIVWKDRERPLTAKGIEQFRDVAKGLCGLGVSLDVVLTSPSLAQCTAPNYSRRECARSPPSSQLNPLPLEGTTLKLR